jgi:phospholipid/cholesterol/gamma-HCH transport system substrate-binding protein
MRNTLETRLGIFVALAVLAVVLILETVGGVDTFRRGLHVYARFNNVQDLKVGNRVKMAGVEVGRVEHIDLTNSKVMVEMKLKRQIDVKTDSIATIKFTGLMGQNFVSLGFGSADAPRAAEGAILESKDEPDLSAIMQKVDNVASGVENLTKSFTGDKIDNLLGPLTDFMKANRGPLTATIANFESISREISEGKGTVGKLIYDDALYNSALSTVTNVQDSVESASSELKNTLADARKIVDGINAGQGTVGKLIKDETLYRETTAMMTNLKEISQKVNQGQGTVGKLINDQEFYKNAKLTLQKLDKATEGLEDQGPLSVMGILVNNLF